MASLIQWIADRTTEDVVFFVKRLSGNDTLANQSHQAGPYIPKRLLLQIVPALQEAVRNPDIRVPVLILPENEEQIVRVVYYNSKVVDGQVNGRDEARITGWGGISSPLLNPENTGALSIFAFCLDANGELERIEVWVCKNADEEDVAEERFGSIDPGQGAIVGSERSRSESNCWLSRDEMNPSWLEVFPTTQELVELSCARRKLQSTSVDVRLLQRRQCEFEIFRSIEEYVEESSILDGFHSLDEFLQKAQSILQRRKSRSGRSLELQARKLLLEESFEDGISFSYQPTTELGKKPDFIFPNVDCYANSSYDPAKLRMLAIKTTCKDRWRQVINEADRIQVKHILTLQEGMSSNQFDEMNSANVRLVVPKPNFKNFNDYIRPHLISVEDFFADARML